VVVQTSAEAESPITVHSRSLCRGTAQPLAISTPANAVASATFAGENPF
jgi:hypothetical protein